MSNHVSVMVTLVTLILVITVGLSVTDAIESSELEELESEGEAEAMDEAERERIEDEFQRAVETMITAVTGLVMSIIFSREINYRARRAVAARAGLEP